MKNRYGLANKNWHSMTSDEVIGCLETNDLKGITEKEAQNRIEEFGKNLLPEGKKESPFIKFLKQFNDVLIFVLLGCAVIAAALRHFVDTGVIIGVVVINGVIGFLQENKAERALEGIKNMLSLRAHVMRDGKRIEIDSADLVVGDIVILNPGDKIPADMRLIKTVNLKVEESALTGESTAVEKSVDVIDENSVLGDRTNMVFSGTAVSAGTGLGVVIATGKDTEIGKINKMLCDVKKITTPLIRQTSKFGKTISVSIVIIAIVVYFFGAFFRDYGTSELLLSVIGLAVAAIPEGLPAILSIILAIGVENMAKRKAIIRNLPSVETLGSVSAICSDKTGTLTKNEMTVKAVVTSDGYYEVSGSGYSPKGEITENNKEINIGNDITLKDTLLCFKSCNDSHLGKDNKGEWIINGDPTEGALLTLAEKSNEKLENLSREATIPFDSEYKYMATLVKDNGKNIVYIKGAPDRLFDIAEKEASKNGEKGFNREYWEKQMKKFASTGKRVIGAAYKKVSKDVTSIDHDDLNGEIIFLGLAGIIDPPREEAIEAIEKCSEAGITVKMITGDHVDTAKAIGKQMGIKNADMALEGKEIEAMTDNELKEAAVKYNIFGRTSPKHKLRLVEAIQSHGQICAMTGDGVNDAPALKRADVGIAMGIKGTEVTKDASEVVLVDDNFRTIVNAVEEGRRVYDNLKKTILFILPTNGAQAFLIIASILFGTLIPLTPVQVLWLNMVISITVSMALAFEKMEKGAMKRPPRNSKAPLLDRYFVWRIVFVSILIGGVTLLINVNLINRGYELMQVRTVTLHIIVISQMFHLFNSRNIRNFAFNKDFFSNKAAFIVSGVLILLQLLITYVPFMNKIFGTVPIKPYQWILPVLIGIGIFIIVEIEKFIMRRIDKLIEKF
ncbi:cation-transporting ATPase Pma1 [Clostridium pasteurianum DSM 525 = ATCC 6013]|uniref:P-type Ca(2+) transporter n=1 Tax=Clostridium pasteurianum DSM 525 = ATCC 6013 TaxID=1262449 RepID=A0A0H3J1I1_CLOPA|nr:cation-transporting P-type ATPase [Clostridium pasteurianum]AJA46592.1 cation-transporting ATPase Pma1 [Clostridium pasteurianum DSM 525 = ATCC 6013]AJA50580.1 cation-transporting ATPase Pma1 [Clostridium pasteurianum DSM 525 = ATCC 6013]AOZ74006.1 carbonate dehydratase [Clostridium pasteurianum DSM 525 = ATCC 6013]AOZ77803.1 carbonate dehydratase [Clostridium pasteurianum]ELP61158.1 cation transport ATPase [Clostridium pasteurianum DSM 525 = ATCC 6013]